MNTKDGKMMTTIKDVAKKAGVSIATVSRVLNKNDRVKAETREKVLSVVEELNYVTNFSAKTLRKSRTNVVGVIVPEISPPFYGEILKGIENKAHENNLRMIVCNAENGVDKERDFVRFLYDRSIEGMICIFPHMTQAEIVRIRKDGHPLVVYGRNLYDVNIHSITLDYRSGAYQAVRHFYSHGYTKIAFIGGGEYTEEYFYDRMERLTGFMQAMHESGLDIQPGYIENGLYREEGAMEAFQRLMNLPDPPQAVFCGNDEMALGVLKAAKDNRIKIPEQMGLIGFDNIRVGQYTCPTLTSVNQPSYTIGNLCCEKLLQMLNSPENKVDCSNLVIQPELVVRESCGC